MKRKPPETGGAAAGRAERLGAALRANLQRRKAQARLRDGQAADGDGDGAASDNETGAQGPATGRPLGPQD